MIFLRESGDLKMGLEPKPMVLYTEALYKEVTKRRCTWNIKAKYLSKNFT